MQLALANVKISLPNAVSIAEYLASKGHDKEANFVCGMVCFELSKMYASQAQALLKGSDSDATASGVLNGKKVIFKFNKDEQVEEKVSQAKSYLSFAIENFEASGKNLQALFYTGIALQWNSDYLGAIEKYEEALTTSSVLAGKVKSVILNNIGVCHYLQGNVDLARFAFKAAGVETNSMNLPLHNLETLSNNQDNPDGNGGLLSALIDHSKISTSESK